ncbi:MAG TPA: type II secretion system F family protein [Marmoricola sp.]|jgi:tight adherence protein C|nr:type II secretion system F family protein [Marmoricola sp.]
MTPVLWGVVLGCLAGVALWSTLERALAGRRTRLEVRVLPYLRDLSPGAPGRAATGQGSGAVRQLVAPWLRRGAGVVERVLGGSASVQRRLDRAGLSMTVHDFRVEQVVWGLVAFLAAAVPAAGLALRDPSRSVSLFVLCCCALAVGVLARENRLTAQVSRREHEMLAEFPTLAELLALAVAAGESAVAALERVVTRSHGELSSELRAVLAEVRTGTPVAQAFDGLAARSGQPAVSRFAEGMAIAVERGTPLAEVLHAQAADVREAERRALIESGARREVAMMVPVVFLVLPVVVVFAFWPGLVGLHLVVP